ncbi:MAG: L-serine ammonia-lyase, iron-sulfur-dependent, subunit alpha [Bacillota bacterium]|nr:L-serine ammonia-lyase, iron-sulfur-dependent, subunit alpha [Bacillota bacterium]
MRPNEISVFDVIGPIMIGPSSSHTAGALRIARVAASLLAEPLAAVRCRLYGSFASTGSGHGTDRALLAGALGFGADDPRIRDSYRYAAEQGVRVSMEPVSLTERELAEMHPNTVDIQLEDRGGTGVSVRGISTGGGRILITRVNGVEVEISGLYNTLVIRNQDRPGVISAMTGILAEHGINIAYMRIYREDRGAMAWAIIETDEAVPPLVPERLRALPSVEQAVLIPQLAPEGAAAGPLPEAVIVRPDGKIETVGRRSGTSRPAGRLLRREDVSFAAAAELLTAVERTGLAPATLMRARECLLFGGDDALHLSRMERSWRVMQRSARAAIESPASSLGGLIGGEAQRVWQHADSAVGGPVLNRAMAYALAVIETNAAMGQIVAAPTAGAAGILPAALLACSETRNASEAALLDALFTAAAVGLFIMAHGSVSGAEGGCQAETGSAAAMAAAALVVLDGGTAAQALAAASTCLQNVLGLVCDPIGGLVEAPCQRRNALGVANALVSAAMALAGLPPVVGLDAMIQALGEVGSCLPASLRETGEGGTAVAWKAEHGVSSGALGSVLDRALCYDN